MNYLAQNLHSGTGKNKRRGHTTNYLRQQILAKATKYSPPSLIKTKDISYSTALEIFESSIPVYNKCKQLSTGILGLDLLLGGGWELGKLAQISGSEQSGKSTIAASSIAASQRRGENVAIVSGMNGGVEEWLLDASGVDRSKLLITEFRTIEESIEASCDLMELGTLSLLVLDDLQRSGVLYSSNRNSKVTKDKARILAEMTRKTNTTLLLITDTTMPWLEANPFWIVQHIHTTYPGEHALNVRAVRTPTGYINQSVKIEVHKSGGVNQALHILRLAAKAGILEEEKNGHIRYNNTYLGRGAVRVAEDIVRREDPILGEIANRLRTEPSICQALFGTSTNTNQESESKGLETGKGTEGSSVGKTTENETISTSTSSSGHCLRRGSHISISGEDSFPSY